MPGLNPCIVISFFQNCFTSGCVSTETHARTCSEEAVEMVEVKERHDDYIHII